MIYTVTFNPALDYVIAVDHFAPGQINRTKEETMVCGGKGINVSALLANLGYESTALGFVAGFTGEEIVRRCQKAGFHSDFIRVKDGLSRINVKMKSDEETEINGMGPDITGKNVELLFEQLNELKAGDVLVLSGSIPSSIRSSIYSWRRCLAEHFPQKKIFCRGQKNCRRQVPVMFWCLWPGTGQCS